MTKLKDAKVNPLIILVIAIICIVVSLSVTLLVAAQSQLNIPVFSDIIEQSEKVLSTDRQTAEMFTDELIKKLEAGEGLNIINSPNFKFNYEVSGEMKTNTSVDFNLSGNGAVKNETNNFMFTSNSTAAISSGSDEFNPELD